MIFIKEHLLKNDYSWLSEHAQATTINNSLTRRRFDRFDGNCVLHILNMFSLLIAKLSIAEAQAIENLISEELPLEAQSEVSVFNWLKKIYLYRR